MSRYLVSAQRVHGNSSLHYRLTALSLVAGAVISQWVSLDDLLSPLELRQGITLGLCRLVLGIQLVLAGIKLPAKYIWTEKRPLLLLLGPGMLLTWVSTSMVIWFGFPVQFPEAMVIAACLAPTDPVLCNNIVSGKFADMHIPSPLRRLLLCESGANDGLGYPFLFAALYYIRYVQLENQAGTALRQWATVVWLWTICFSVLYGAVVGLLARKTHQAASRRGFVDRESTSFIPVTLALFVVGTSGILRTDDVLAAFIAGCVFNWDDW